MASSLKISEEILQSAMVDGRASLDMLSRAPGLTAELGFAAGPNGPLQKTLVFAENNWRIRRGKIQNSLEGVVETIEEIHAAFQEVDDETASALEANDDCATTPPPCDAGQSYAPPAQQQQPEFGNEPAPEPQQPAPHIPPLSSGGAAGGMGGSGAAPIPPLQDFGGSGSNVPEPEAVAESPDTPPVSVPPLESDQPDLSDAGAQIDPVVDGGFPQLPYVPEREELLQAFAEQWSKLTGEPVEEVLALVAAGLGVGAIVDGDLAGDDGADSDGLADGVADGEGEASDGVAHEDLDQLSDGDVLDEQPDGHEGLDGTDGESGEDFFEETDVAGTAVEDPEPSGAGNQVPDAVGDGGLPEPVVDLPEFDDLVVSGEDSFADPSSVADLPPLGTSEPAAGTGAAGAGSVDLPPLADMPSSALDDGGISGQDFGGLPDLSDPYGAAASASNSAGAGLAGLGMDEEGTRRGAAGVPMMGRFGGGAGAGSAGAGAATSANAGASERESAQRNAEAGRGRQTKGSDT